MSEDSAEKPGRDSLLFPTKDDGGIVKSFKSNAGKVVRNSSAGDDGTSMFKEADLIPQTQSSVPHQNIYGFQDLKASKKTAAQSYSDHFEPMKHQYSSIDPNL